MAGENKLWQMDTGELEVHHPALMGDAGIMGAQAFQWHNSLNLSLHLHI